MAEKITIFTTILLLVYHCAAPRYYSCPDGTSKMPDPKLFSFLGHCVLGPSGEYSVSGNLHFGKLDVNVLFALNL